MIDRSFLKDFELGEDGRYHRKGNKEKRKVLDGDNKRGAKNGEESSIPVYNREDTSIWIAYNVPSKKNSKRILYKTGKNGRKHPFIGSSLLVKEYEKVTAMAYAAHAKEFRRMAEGKKLPLIVQMTFVRSSKRRIDFNNISQVICDLMQEYEWIEDDNMDHLIAIPPLEPPHYYIDKFNPGVKIEVL